MIAFLEEERARSKRLVASPALPAPLNPHHWEQAHSLPFSKVSLKGPWTIRRWSKLVWIDQTLFTAAPGARLSFAFKGRGLSLGFDFGKKSAEFRYRLDGGEWQASKRDRPAWCGDEGWFRISPIADDLPDGKHTFELEVIHGNDANCTGTNFNLALIGIIAGNYTQRHK